MTLTHLNVVMRFYKLLILNFFSLSLVGCLGLEKSESKKERQANLVAEPIKRKKGEHFLFLKEPEPSKAKASYPWQKKNTSSFPQITKEFFRCKGNPLHPPVKVETNSMEISYQLDCEGIERHSLPIKGGEEYIYPILIELLNTIQQKAGKQVIITSGHRCPIHNSYVDSSSKNRVSKHLMGAEVDFYVKGLENNPLPVMAILEAYYKESKEFSPLKQNERQWSNQEVIITLHPPLEKRNGDNEHPYPYFSIEVRYDRETKKSVPFSWHQAYNSFYRSYH